MPVTSRILPRRRFVFAPVALVVAALGLTVRAQPPDPKSEPKTAPAPRELPGVKLPDGTFLWLGGEGDERVGLTPQELQKLHDQIEQLKKQLAAQKAVPPSGCAVRGRVEKRGEQF